MYIGVPEKDQERFARAVEASRVKDYVCPTTAEEYWLVAEKYLEELSQIVYKFYGKNYVTSDGRTADQAVIKAILKANLRKGPESFVRILNNSWSEAPDSGEIHLIPGWNVLCDLCSESYLVLQEQE